LNNQPNLVAARYGAGNEPAVSASSAVIESLLGHRSVRGYRPDQLQAGQLELILAAAQAAASSSNLQTFSIIVVEDQAKKERLAEFAGGQKHIIECPVYLLFCADLSRLRRIANEREMPSAGLDYFEMFLVAAIDAAIAAQNACAAAESLGLGTVYIGAMRNRPEETSALLGLPDGVAVVFGLCIGHAAEGAEGMIKPRLPQMTIVHREHYDVSREAEAVAAYNQAMDAFYKAQAMNVKVLWAEHSARRVAGPEVLSGRDRLLQALKGMGFMRAET
jgi:nitroreductase